MQLEVIGVGGAGCRMADAIRAAEPSGRSFLADVFVFDTDPEALANYTVLPESHRHRYGAEIDLDDVGRAGAGGTNGGGDETDENGTDSGSRGLEGNLERGFELGEEYADELDRVLDRGRPAASDAFLVAVGLGGATGGGTVPALVATLQRQYDQPVYVLATLPADREFTPPDDDAPENAIHSGVTNPGAADETPPRPTAASNAIRTLESLEGLASAVVLFDNEAWLRTGESLEEGRRRCNRAIATRVTALFAAGSASGEAVAENVIDASDVARIMGNETAYVSLGYGDQDVETGGSRFGLGLFGSKTEVETASAVSAVETVVRKGIHGKLSLECDPETAERGLLIVGGPPAWLNRRAIAEGRRTLESTIGGAGVLGGDAPRPDGETVFAGVVLADVESPRLEELRAAGTRAE